MLRSDVQLRLAIGQVRMHWTIEGNLSEMCSAMQVARREGADLCVFPELAIPGFHREIVNLAKPDLIAEAVRVLQAEAATLSLATAFGVPTFRESAVLNSYVLLTSSAEQIAVIDKNGLTDPEATFFTRGSDRPATKICGVQTSAVICREIEDIDHVCLQLQDQQVELLLWPGHMRPDPKKPTTDPPEHVAQAQALATRLNAYVVQANWPNALNRPDESSDTGHSAVINPSGALAFRAPKAQPGVAVFTLGERQCSWFASEA